MKKTEQRQNQKPLPRGYKNLNTTQLSESRDQNVTTRVLASSPKHRVLPTWTCRTCLASSVEGHSSDHISGKKEKHHQWWLMVKYLSSGGRLFRVLQMNFLKWWRLDASCQHQWTASVGIAVIWVNHRQFWNSRSCPKIFSIDYFSNGSKVKGKLFEETMLEITHWKRVHCPSFQHMGGFALYWRNGIDLNVMCSSPTYINAVVNPGVDDAWQLTGIYEDSVMANREHS